MGKLTLLAGAAIGYVLGAKAGRERYEQIMRRASKTWSSEPVQSKIGTAKETVKTRAPKVADKVGKAAKHAESKVKGKVTGKQDAEERTERDTDGRVHADVSGFAPGPDELP